MSHTPEPWHVFNHSWSDTSVLADGFDHAICCLDINHATEESQEKDAELMEANARRIVACVNWCKGNSTEGMERAVEIGRPYAVERDDAYGRELEITKQRDELLAALEKVLATRNDEAKAEAAFNNAAENFTDDSIEEKAYEKALVAANTAESEARAVIASVKGGA